MTRFNFVTLITIDISGATTEHEVQVTGEFTRGSRPVLWGDCPDPGSPDEFDFDPIRIPAPSGSKAEPLAIPLWLISEEQRAELEADARASMEPDPDYRLEEMRDGRRDELLRAVGALDL